MKCHFAVIGAILLAAALLARGQGADEKYVQIYNWIQEADALNTGGQGRQAITKYQEAQTALKGLQTAYPGWHSNVVSFRLNYLASQLEPLFEKFPPTNAAPAVTPEAVPSGDGGVSAMQLKAMQEQIWRLTATNDLLRAKLKEALSVQPAATDPRELAKAEEKIRDLEKQRDLLKVSLEQEQGKVTKGGEASALDQERQLLAEAKQKLAQQMELTASLQKENEGLKQQNELLRGKTGAAAAGSDLAEQLTVAKLTIAALQATNTALRADMEVMKARLEEISKPAKRGDRSELSPQELLKQLEAARARLELYESKPLPYLPEELALFKQPDARITGAQVAVAVATTNAAARRTPRELPPGAGPLMTEVERAVDVGRFDEAEKKLSQILQQDENNVYVLSRLAAVQMDEKHLDDSEKTLKRALAIDPQDAGGLLLLGHLKFMQEKYDDALDALSRSAQLIPDDFRTQYFLGKVLIQKGNRLQAEKALRKAVQLKPGWGEAHYSLALVYATQQPPFKELAQWHYQKAIAGGYPRNPDFEKMIEEKQAAAK